ncbi:MAG: hypothetical protein LBU14_01680 [Candidatus Peribacteria bacterium]|nr:hypothetical protein [Candidatus Peribacteria bacterium]
MYHSRFWAEQLLLVGTSEPHHQEELEDEELEPHQPHLAHNRTFHL